MKRKIYPPQQKDSPAPVQNNGMPASAFHDNRPQTATLLQMKEMMQHSLRTTGQREAFTGALGDSAAASTNKTGMPDELKAGLENLSGIDLSTVKVHYNSEKPAQLHAHAYAQGHEIHLAPGQERHLPHEGWHVVQQQQQKVKPTGKVNGEVRINDDAALEREADVMGAKALQGNSTPSLLRAPATGATGDVVQGKFTGIIGEIDGIAVFDEVRTRMLDYNNAMSVSKMEMMMRYAFKARREGGNDHKVLAEKVIEEIKKEHDEFNLIYANHPEEKKKPGDIDVSEEDAFVILNQQQMLNELFLHGGYESGQGWMWNNTFEDIKNDPDYNNATTEKEGVQQSWKIHLAVSPLEAGAFAMAVHQVLNGVAIFKIDPHLHKYMRITTGTEIGKFITIYTVSGTHHEQIMALLADVIPYFNAEKYLVRSEGEVPLEPSGKMTTRFSNNSGRKKRMLYNLVTGKLEPESMGVSPAWAIVRAAPHIRKAHREYRVSRGAIRLLQQALNSKHPEVAKRAIGSALNTLLQAEASGLDVSTADRFINTNYDAITARLSA